MGSVKAALIRWSSQDDYPGVVGVVSHLRRVVVSPDAFCYAVQRRRSRVGRAQWDYCSGTAETVGNLVAKFSDDVKLGAFLAGCDPDPLRACSDLPAAVDAFKVARAALAVRSAAVKQIAWAKEREGRADRSHVGRFSALYRRVIASDENVRIVLCECGGHLILQTVPPGQWRAGPDFAVWDDVHGSFLLSDLYDVLSAVVVPERGPRVGSIALERRVHALFEACPPTADDAARVFAWQG